MTIDPRTPIIVGVGQFRERLGMPGYAALGPADLAARAARAACEDALGGSEQWQANIDAIATTRTFEDSRTAAPLFGRSTNYPRSVANRLGISPRLAVWAQVGGETPQTLVADLGARIFHEDVRMALLAGGEAISTARAASKEGRRLEWAESPVGDVEDHGPGTQSFMSPYNQRHGLRGAPLSYGLLENARRHRLGRSRADYERGMGELFAPFTHVAARNPYAAFAVKEQSLSELVLANPRNRRIADPYRLRLVAKDQVNQGAALLLTSVASAMELGIAPNRWCFIQGHAQGVEAGILDRGDLGSSPVAQAVAKVALDVAERKIADCQHLDFYSCFPIAVSNVACDGLGLEPKDPRGLTVTGGLPYFGGPGNNYSMHAIATIVDLVRRSPGNFGMVVANGGYLSKHAAGVYSTKPADWKEWVKVEPFPTPQSVHLARDQVVGGPAVVESSTLAFDADQATMAIVAARMTVGGTRVLAVADHQSLAQSVDMDPIGRHINIHQADGRNSYFFA